MTGEKAYRFYLSSLCYELGRMAVMREEILAGKTVDKAILADALEKAAEYKKELLKVKEAAGLPGGISFLEDNRFAGFSMENGILKGDKTFLYKIVTPWLNEYPNGDCYRYEVANLVVAYEMAREDYYREHLTVTKPVRNVEKGKKRRVCWTVIKERLLDFLVF